MLFVKINLFYLKKYIISCIYDLSDMRNIGGYSPDFEEKY